jgi:hypothetical protein
LQFYLVNCEKCWHFNDSKEVKVGHVKIFNLTYEGFHLQSVVMTFQFRKYNLLNLISKKWADLFRSKIHTNYHNQPPAVSGFSKGNKVQKAVYSVISKRNFREFQEYGRNFKIFTV